MYLVDTNIFLEVMLLRAKREECANFLKLLAEGKKSGSITDFSIHSIIVIMDNFRKKKELRTFLSSLAGYKGLSIYNTRIRDEINAVDIGLESGLDIEDAIRWTGDSTHRA